MDLLNVIYQQYKLNLDNVELLQDTADTAIEQFIDGYKTVRNMKFDSTTIKMFRGLSATLYASWVFSPENQWVQATKLDYGKDALEKIRYL